MRIKFIKILFLSLVTILLICYFFCLNYPLFNKPVSIVINDNNNQLIGAHISDDQQWRFPHNHTISYKYIQSLIAFEDKRFFYHNGVDFFSLLRAVYYNFSRMSIVSGGSTITMQAIRLSRGIKHRNLIEKIIEIIYATRLELSYTKFDILSLYSSNAPFGGNIVGLDAAAWRYFGRKPENLSWAESATLAVLPNSPALIHPGRNRKKLTEKRNRLLNKLLENNIIDSSTYELSISETIPEKPLAFPQDATHLLNRVYNQYNGKSKLSVFNTTINSEYQKKVTEITNSFSKIYSANNINNIAAIVIENETGNVLSYVGNSTTNIKKNIGENVDIIMANRSTGSILKPFLYASMLTNGDILPNSLVPDIPIQIKGYSPKNFSRGYDGAVPASKAIARSLNVPAVKMLQNYGIEKFIFILRKLGLSTIDKNSDYYGLSLILGGSEGKLFEIAGAYSSMARTLNHFNNNNSLYITSDYHLPNIFTKRKKKLTNEELEKNSFLSASAIWHTFNTMVNVERPEDESNWEMFSSKEKIAWKTGTSFGFRDGWAIGITKDFTVGVWVGNADGEGRPELTGIKTAAPVLFEIFNFLPTSDSWFYQPYDDMIKMSVCRKSGYLSSENCTETDSVWLPLTSINFPKCPFHKIIHTDLTEKYRVTDDCESTFNMKHISWFILPPAMEYYYKQNNSSYKIIPPYRKDCITNISGDIKSMEIIYPDNLSEIYIPKDFNGNRGNCIFEVAHNNPNAILFWHIDEQYVGSTQTNHKMPVSPKSWQHILSIFDDNGNKIIRLFKILDKEKSDSNK